MDATGFLAFANATAHKPSRSASLPAPERFCPIQKRGMRRVADVREPHGSAKPKQAASCYGKK